SPARAVPARSWWRRSSPRAHPPLRRRAPALLEPGVEAILDHDRGVEVDQLDLDFAVREVDQDVVPTQVAVDHASLMPRLQGRRELHADADHLVRAERYFGIDVLTCPPARAQLHGDVRLALVGVQLEERRQVRVANVAQDPRLKLEAQ